MSPCKLGPVWDTGWVVMCVVALLGSRLGYDVLLLSTRLTGPRGGSSELNAFSRA